MFRRLNHWLGECTGYKVAKATRRGLPHNVVDDPLQAGYFDPGPGHGCTICAPTDKGVGFNAFSLGPETYHPWVVAVRTAENSNDQSSLSRVLSTYYSMVRPKSLIDWLDVPKQESLRIDSLPVHAWSVLPWSTMSPCKIIRAIEAAQVAENRMYGLDEGMSAGAKAFGPVSEGKLRVETIRISELYESLKKRGLDHQRSDYNLRATFLVAGRRWTWLSMGGMHRVAMAAAVGLAHIPVRVAAVVRRDEVDMWPQVASGLYDRDTALRLFDRLIDRRPPRCVNPWIDWVDRYSGISGNQSVS